MRAHHRRVTLESTGGEDNGVGIERCGHAIAGLSVYAADAITIPHHQPRRLGFVANLHPCRFCRLEKLCDDGAAAADWLDTGRTGAEIIGRNDEFDAVRPEPSNRLHRVLRERPEIA